MKKTLWMMLVGSVVLVALSDQSFAGRRALVYQGPGACAEGCAQAAYDMAARNGFTPTYVGPNALNSKTSDKDVQELFRDVAVWIQPGGKSKIVMQNMTPQMVRALRDFVSNGGGYVGFCAGAFASTRIVGTTHVAGYGFLPGRTELYKSKKNADIIDITWNGVKRGVYWEGGPFIANLPIGKAEPTAFYPNGQIASARSIYGLGKVYVTGLHPEAPQWWRDDYHMNDKDGLDFDLVDEMIAWVTQ